MYLKHAIIMCIFMSCLGCSKQGPAGFSSPDELMNAYVESYEQGDIDKLMNMVMWSDTPQELKDLYRALMSMGIGKHRFENIEVVPYDSLPLAENTTGKEVVPTIEPTHWLIGEHKGNLGYEGSESTGAIQFAIGKKDGRYFISGLRYK